MTMCNMEIFIMYHVYRGDNIEKYHHFLKIRGLRRGGAFVTSQSRPILYIADVVETGYVT